MHITVYCGSNYGTKAIYPQVARELGTWIGSNQHTLVYGGSQNGLMGILADACVEAGGTIIGVLPDVLKDQEEPHPALSEMIRVSTMSERKDILFDLGDAFIALPGGPGTLEEMVDVISWGRIGLHAQPCIFLNIDHYYAAIYEQYQHMVHEGFISAEVVANVYWIHSVYELTRILSQAPL
ncbi:TIGR00730 family Rossman fold protein [Suicoccus acidiformans]|uniref:Cytokinin riboside 5'-monophosphate phosphoribohydrolase n=1 Tax=Suicoccus acidiformans TaxID=2036206 RepID=A0A347WHT9_9LACT|nr:TIGR00730 family Rossman fold protein [Suicoccus acidiformans]AXY24646.1 TIGR00730 family Rossman fold protein [Suicoccus acidiformans]